jgi:hypothetical protein
MKFKYMDIQCFLSLEVHSINSLLAVRKGDYKWAVFYFASEDCPPFLQKGRKKKRKQNKKALVNHYSLETGYVHSTP